MYTVPTKGSKVVLIKLAKVRGNKNVTTISNLQSFGIVLDEELRKALARRFSVSVSLAPTANQKEGLAITVQGKYVMQLQEFLMERFGIPAKFFKIEAKGLTKRDKAAKV